MNRIGAAGIHLGISFLIFLVLGYIVVFVWYPDFFFTTDGGWQGIRIIAAVDLVLGPMLTLVVFKQGKPGLKTDLAMIGLFQGLCLFAGTYIVYSERPVAMVYSDGQFFSMGTDAYLDAGAEIPDLSGFPGPSPKWVTLSLPEDLGEQIEIRRRALEAQRPLRTYSELYVPFTLDMLDPAEAFEQNYLALGDRFEQAIPRWLSEHGGELSDYAFYLMGARYSYVFLGIHVQDRKIVGILDTPAPGNQTAAR
jgi:hypothetical protein